MEVDKIFYFKPAKPHIMNAYHPDIKSRLFQIMLGPDRQYHFRYMMSIEEIRATRTKIENMFHELHWIDFIEFDIIDDYNEWLNQNESAC